MQEIQREQAPMGWLDGFTNAACTQAGHVCLPIGDVVALIWPESSQGNLVHLSQRLLSVGQTQAILPARLGQRMWSKGSSMAALQDRQLAIGKALAHFGRMRQVSVSMPAALPAPLPLLADLRAKHMARQKTAQAMLEAARPVHRIMMQSDVLPVKTLGPLQSGASRCVLHLLFSAREAAHMAQRLTQALCVDTDVALVGPLPPFAFVAGSMVQDAADG